MKALDESVRKMFSDPVLSECFGDRAMYSIPQSDVSSLADVFAALEKGTWLFVLYTNGFETKCSV